LKYSSSKENYLKAIFHLQEMHGMVNTNALANELQTRPASVTDMLKKLKTQKLLLYEKYQGFKLSQEGKKVALMIIRKHRLWEYFLVEKLQFGWDEVHEIAEELEHISSTRLVDKLDEFLGYPKSDPHGDPIPDGNGKFITMRQVDLLHLPISKTGEVSSIGDQSAEMLELLTHKNIGLGTLVEVSKRFSFDNSVELLVYKAAEELPAQDHDKKSKPKSKPVQRSNAGKAEPADASVVTISEHVAKNVFVKYDEQTSK
jgi:DtxR family Mn-dependent transcriptional regulator